MAAAQKFSPGILSGRTKALLANFHSKKSIDSSSGKTFPMTCPFASSFSRADGVISVLMPPNEWVGKVTAVNGIGVRLLCGCYNHENSVAPVFLGGKWGKLPSASGLCAIQNSNGIRPTQSIQLLADAACLWSA